MKKKDWTALYLPATDKEDPTRSGFKTPGQAEKYSQRYWCKLCQKEYTKFLKWERNGSKPSFEEWSDEKIREIKNYNKMNKKDKENLHIDLDIEFMSLYGDSFNGCAAEWLIIETEKLKNCENFGDVMEVIGAKRIWSKKSKDLENG